MTPGSGDRTPPTHDVAFEALLGREPIFQREPVGSGRDAFERITAPDFWLVDASGVALVRDDVIDALVARQADPQESTWHVEAFAVRQLGVITWLATYVLVQDELTTRQSTIWTYVGGDWIAIYHQGTLA